MRLYSIRRATFAALIAPMLLALLLVAGAGFWSAHKSISTLRDHEMQQESAFLLMLSLHEAAEGERLGAVQGGESDQLRRLRGRGTGFRIWSGEMVLTAAGALPAAGSQPPAPGFGDFDADGREWRRYASRGAGLPITVEVVEPAELRDAMALRVAASMTWPMLLLILAVSAIGTWRVAAALRPMEAISGEIDARDTDDLRPVRADQVPVEIAPLLVALNDLLARLGEAIQREREFAENAAHELRTPLAVLKTRAQIAERALAGNPALQAELASLDAAIDRATGVIEQLLLLARLQGGHARFAEIDLSSLVEEVARDLAPQAIARGQAIEAEIAPAILVRGNADSLSMVVRNLIDNAIRYAPPGGHIAVTLAGEPDGGALLRVVDDGPGIAPDAVGKAFQRFARLDRETQGSGLGLAIVERVLDQHGGSIALLPAEPHGLVCEVRLPGEAGVAQG